MTNATIVHSWQGNEPGYSDVTLQPGQYRFAGTSIYSVERVVERVPEGEPVWLSSDDAGPTREPARVVLAPIASTEPLVVSETIEVRVHRGPGHLELTAVTIPVTATKPN